MSTERAWRFVAENQGMIDRMCNCFGGALRGDERQEYRHDVILRIVSKFPTLRLETARNREALVSTWIGYQARGVQCQYTRRFKKSVREGNGLELEQLHELPATMDGWGSASETERIADCDSCRTVIEKLYSVANTHQRNAILSVLADLPARETHKRYGFSQVVRNRHLTELGLQLDMEVSENATEIR